MRRALATPLLGAVAGVALMPLFAVAAPASAAEGPGDGFSSVTLSSVAVGGSYAFANQANAVPAESDIPYAATQVKLGQGQATAAVAWPGETAASLGSLVTLLVPSAPSQVLLLNDPAYARAQSGKGPDTVTNTTVPGATVTAHATTTETTAESSVEGASTLATTIGSAKVTSAATLTDAAKAQVTGTTTVRDVTIGPVHIATVTSSATATTDGVKPTASGTTSVSGLTVAGQAVTIDERGLTVAGSTLPVGPVITAVSQALKQAHITLTLSRPTKTVKGGSVEYATGSLIVSTELGILAFGGVQLRGAATLADALSAGSPAPVEDTDPGAGAGNSGAEPRGGFAAPQPLSPAEVRVPQPTQVSTPALPTSGPAARASLVSLATGYSQGWVAAGLLLAFTAAAGIAAFADRLLPALDDSCPLERPL